MSETIATYLHDHLAGANFALELLDALAGQHEQQPLAGFLRKLHAEIAEDRDVLRDLVHRLGSTSRPTLKEAAAWLGEKASRWKLSHDDKGALGSFEALEALSLGIQGKLALWRALKVMPENSPIYALDLDRLIQRAEDQYGRVEQWRLRMARAAFELAQA